MTDQEKRSPEEEEESPALSALLKRSLARPSADAPNRPDVRVAALAPPLHEDDELLKNVQRKLRMRSKGKFYSDGWSTTNARFNYVLVAGIMLATVVAVYLALGPTGITR